MVLSGWHLSPAKFLTGGGAGRQGFHPSVAPCAQGGVVGPWIQFMPGARLTGCRGGWCKFLGFFNDRFHFCAAHGEGGCRLGMSAILHKFIVIYHRDCSSTEVLVINVHPTNYPFKELPTALLNDFPFRPPGDKAQTLGNTQAA
jgi:hypothetical protein